MAIQWQGWMRYLFGGLWNPDQGMQQAGPSTYSNASHQTVTDSTALQIAAVFRCIRIIAETSASLPMQAWQITPSGDRKPLRDSHYLNGLICEPNPEMVGDEWREACFGQMAGWGNAYSQMVRQSEGRVAELWPYKPDRMQVNRNPDMSLAYRYPDAMGRPADLERRRVLHMRAFSLDGVMGLSPLGLARESLGLAIGAERYAASFFGQGGRPAGVMTSDKPLTDKQREQVRTEFGGLAGGGTDKRLWVLEANMKYQAVTVSPEDMQMLQTRAFQISDIARFFGVPLFLLMETEKSTSWGSGIEQQNLGFLTYTLRPYLTRMIESFNRWVIAENDRGKICVDIDVAPLLALDSAGQKELYASLTSNGVMTRNEVRRIMKLPQSAQKNADSLTVQTALTTIDELQRPPGAPTAPQVTRDMAPVAIEVDTKATQAKLDAVSEELARMREQNAELLKKFQERKTRVTVPKRGPDGRVQRWVTVEE